MAKEIVEIPTERLLPNPYQPRKQFSSEEMLGLAAPFSKTACCSHCWHGGSTIAIIMS